MCARSDWPSLHWCPATQSALTHVLHDRQGKIRDAEDVHAWGVLLLLKKTLGGSQGKAALAPHPRAEGGLGVRAVGALEHDMAFVRLVFLPLLSW